MRPDILILLEWTGVNDHPRQFENNGYRLALDAPEKGTHGIAVLSPIGHTMSPIGQEYLLHATKD